MLVYIIENKINGKKYVGITKHDKEKRFRGHVTHANHGSNYHLHQAIRKYGKENFTIFELESCNFEQELNEREKYWISKLDTKNNGYNKTDGGEQERFTSAIKNSEAQKKRFSNPEERKNHSISTKLGYQKWWNSLTEEEQKDWKNRCSKRPENYIHPSRKHSEETKLKMSISRKGKKMGPQSEEHKRKISESKKGQNTGKNNVMSNPEVKEKHRLALIESHRIRKLNRAN